MLYIYPYSKHSESARLIANAMKCKRLKRESSTVKDSESITIINWGAASVPYSKARIINSPAAVNTARNKLSTFRALETNRDIRIPTFTTDYNTAIGWMTDGVAVCSRAVLTGNSGEGLVISSSREDIPRNSPLYTRYIPKTAEFRVHVINGAVVRVQKKVLPRNTDRTNVNWQVRNHENGFIFQIASANDIPSPSILQQAVLATSHLGLDFAGVDVIWTNSTQRPTILELNTAPGVEGGTVDIYAEALQQLVRRTE